jgi:hypothetical protein
MISFIPLQRTGTFSSKNKENTTHGQLSGNLKKILFLAPVGLFLVVLETESITKSTRSPLDRFK